MTKKELNPDENLGTKYVYFRGSNRHLWREGYLKGDKVFVQWYGEMIEIKHRDGFFPHVTGDWYTVEEY